MKQHHAKTGQHWADAAGNPLRANERPGDPELLTQHEIQEACPDLLVTSYLILEYMLLRPLEREIFTQTRAHFEANPSEKFLLILDEAHLYLGANGTEVTSLVRRLLDRLGLPRSRVVFIATSASFSNAEAAKELVSGLCGLDATAIQPLPFSSSTFSMRRRDLSVIQSTPADDLPRVRLQKSSHNGQIFDGPELVKY